MAKSDPTARRSYLDEACDGDEALRRRLQLLIESHERAGSILDQPVVEPLEDVPNSGSQETESTRPYSALTRTLAADDPRENPVDDEEIVLDFLQPSSKPEMLGRMGPYEVMEVLGHGGFGVVLRAFDERLHRVVAIKVLKPRLAATSPPRKRFLREARAAAAVHHENVVTIFAVEDDPIPYLVMEFVAGRTLQQKLDETGPLDLSEVLAIGQQVASGLAASHAKGLIHRDIKPSNIMLEEGSGRIKITDFGLARAADDANLTQSGFIIGTPQYMAPEQALAGTIDQRSDLFSLGSVLYAACSGRPPFRAPTTLAVLKRLTEDTPRPIREIIPETPDWLCAIIEKLHAKNPDERYATALEVAGLLERCRSELNQFGALRSYDGIPRATSSPHAPGEETHAAPRAARHGGSTRRLAFFAVCMIVLLTAVLLIQGFLPVPFGSLRPQRQTTSNPADQPEIAAHSPIEKPAVRSSAAPIRHEAAADSDWAARVRGLSEPEQKTEFVARLKELNPEFDEDIETGFHFENGVMLSMSVRTDHVSDISFFRGFPALEALALQRWKKHGKLADLTPLRDLRLKIVDLSGNLIEDITSLEGHPLKQLSLMGNPVHALEPLRKSPLHDLNLWDTKSDDASLAALKDMKTLRILNIGGCAKITEMSPIKALTLDSLCINHTKISNLSPIKTMPLTTLLMAHTRVEDLSPIKGMRLKEIDYAGSPIRDITALRDMPLEVVGCDFDPDRDAAILRAIPTLKTINHKPVADFWKKYDADKTHADPH